MPLGHGEMLTEDPCLVLACFATSPNEGLARRTTAWIWMVKPGSTVKCLKRLNCSRQRLLVSERERRYVSCERRMLECRRPCVGEVRHADVDDDKDASTAYVSTHAYSPFGRHDHCSFSVDIELPQF